MEFGVIFVHGGTRAAGQCIYRIEDMVLEYSNLTHQTPPFPDSLATGIERSIGIKHPDFLAIADTLTLVFSGREKRLVSLDAYTNYEHWTVSHHLSTPTVSASGLLVLSAFPPDTARVTLETTPVYELDAERRWIRIALQAGSPEQYFEVALGLVVGLVGERIADLFLLHPTFR